VLIVPGSKILSPLIRFRNYFFAVGGIFILVILFLIRFVTGRTVSSIKDVSEAAHRVAEGDYEVSLSAKTQDEVGELIHSFNTIVGEFCLEVGFFQYAQNNLLIGKIIFSNQDGAGKAVTA